MFFTLLASAAAIYSLVLLVRKIQTRLISRLTVLAELPLLGQRRSVFLDHTVVICGGSVAGLFAARVCSDHFRDVLVIDPDNDTLIGQAKGPLNARSVERISQRNPRVRVMQYLVSHHVQVLALRILERLFPDIRLILDGLGVPLGPCDGMYHLNGRPIGGLERHYPSGLPDNFLMRRETFEPMIRHLVQTRCPNVRFVRGTVTGIQTQSRDASIITGVTFRQDGKVLDQEADLLVDCTGMSAAGLSWLKRFRHNFDPEEIKESYRSGFTYTTCTYKVDPAIMRKIVPFSYDKARTYLIFLFPAPGGRETRMYSLVQVDDNHIEMILGGPGEQPQTRNAADIRAYVDSLQYDSPVPGWLFDLFDYLEENCEDGADHIRPPLPTLYFNKYHQSSTPLPGNFVALGDAVMVLNPSTGNGITKALVGATVLNTCLTNIKGESIPTHFARRFFERQAAKIESIWRTTKYNDYGAEGCRPARGETRENGKWTRWYGEQIERLRANGDVDVHRHKWEVAQGIAPATDMFTPSVLMKVLWIGLGLGS